MGKSTRRKQLEAIKQEYIEQHGDGRSDEARANARAMLDKLQRKLEDDALREDGSSPGRFDAVPLFMTRSIFDIDGRIRIR